MTSRSSVAPGTIADPALELGELADALLAAHGDDLVAAIQRVLDHVAPELPGRADDADPHGAATTSPGAAITGISGPSMPAWRPSS